MNKINGYTEEEARSFVQYMYAGRRAGRTLSSLFEGYAAKSGRAKGSVRNYYYALLRSTGNKEVKNFCAEPTSKPNPYAPFPRRRPTGCCGAYLPKRARAYPCAAPF